MKIFFFLLLAGSCGLLWAQTNPPVPRSLDQEIGLRSDHFYYDPNARQLVNYGHVVATNWEGKLTCERLTISLPPEGSADSHPTNMVAETNVVVDFVKNGETNHITSDKATYAYSVVNAVTNETITFTGHARAENAKGWMTGEPLVWDNIAGRFSGSNEEGHFNIPRNSGNGTNAPAAATNELTATKINLPPGADTNFPPGKLDLVPPGHADSPWPQPIPPRQ